MFRVPKAWLICSSVLALTTLILQAQAPGDALESNDAIARLGRQMAAREVALDYREGAGYLPSLLERLGINVDSQVLVFSKTSFQHAFINPKNPRALYFNDNVSVGTVPGGSVYEMMALEPSRGLAFYSLDVRQADHPVFQRRGVECLFCHGPGNNGAAGMVVASVFPDAQGVPAYTSAFISTIGGGAGGTSPARMDRKGTWETPSRSIASIRLIWNRRTRRTSPRSRRRSTSPSI
jgi:hypothetical protein